MILFNAKKKNKVYPEGEIIRGMRDTQIGKTVNLICNVHFSKININNSYFCIKLKSKLKS